MLVDSLTEDTYDMRDGICKLCLEAKRLHKSHLIPAAVYRECREPSLKNKDPMMSSSDLILQNSRPIRDFVLCGAWERSFGRNGEDWVMKFMAHRDHSFPLLEALKRRRPFDESEGLALYSSAKVPEVKMTKLGYFAMSMFWRSGAHSWKTLGREIPRIALGEMQERVRLFLLGIEGFPEEAVLFVKVCPEPGVVLAAYTPRLVRMGNVHEFRFYIPGIEFELWVGHDARQKLKRFCSYSAPEQPLYVTLDVAQEAKEAVRVHARTARLAKNVQTTLEPIAQPSVRRS